MEARVFAHIPFPLVSENDVGLGLVGKDQKQLDTEALCENPANDRNHRGDTRAAGHKPHLLRHAVHPMAARIRPAHQHGVSDLPVMEVPRNCAGFVPLDRQVEVPRGAGHRRRGVRTFHRLPVDRGEDVKMIAGQHIQCSVVGQGKAERLRVVSVLSDGRELVGGRLFGLDARDGFRSHASIIRRRRDDRNWRDGLRETNEAS